MYKVYLPLPRIDATQNFYVAGSGNVMASIIPDCETRGEVAFYRYFDEVIAPSFRIELNRFNVLDVHPTSAKFYFPHREGFELVEVHCSHLLIPIEFPQFDRREVYHALVSDVGHVWLIHTPMTVAEQIFFMSVASSPEGDKAVPKTERTCIGHVRNAHKLDRKTRILNLMKIVIQDAQAPKKGSHNAK